MPLPKRDLILGYSYHVTTRCYNREFKLTRRECRQVFLYAINKALAKFQFQLYAICIMSNHVHYLIEPAQPQDLPKIMHWVNWYTAMCFNRMLFDLRLVPGIKFLFLSAGIKFLIEKLILACKSSL